MTTLAFDQSRDKGITKLDQLSDQAIWLPHTCRLAVPVVGMFSYMCTQPRVSEHLGVQISTQQLGVRLNVSELHVRH